MGAIKLHRCNWTIPEQTWSSEHPRLAIGGRFEAMRVYVTLQKLTDSHTVLEIFEFDTNMSVCAEKS